MSDSKIGRMAERQKTVEPSLSYPFLTDDATVQFIKKSKVIFVMRGLPGSGKSTIVRSIKEVSLNW